MGIDREATETHVLRLEQTVRATPEAAYDAMTAPEHVSTWFSTRAEADLRVGGRYWNADGDGGEWLVLDRPTRVSFTWDNAKHCPGTVVDVTFADVTPRGPDSAGEAAGEAATRIVLEHRGLRTVGDVDDMRSGWSWALASLRSYLETGRPIPYEEWAADTTGG